MKPNSLMKSILGVPLVRDLRAVLRARRAGSNHYAHFAAPGHYYSPLPDFAAVQAVTDRECDPHVGLHGIDLRLEDQLRLWKRLIPRFAKLQLPENPEAGMRYYYANPFFGHGDAEIAAALLLELNPRRVLEVGSGFSSALLLEVSGRQSQPAELTFVEPDPIRLNALLLPEDRQRVIVIQSPVQTVPIGRFEELAAGDWLFIDSSHVAKCGSDVLFLLFEILPQLPAGVVVHVHDIFWPFEYPEEWFREGRAWNEAYFLRAYLTGQQGWEILFWNPCFAKAFPAQFQKDLPLGGKGGTSIWLRRRET